MTTQTGNESAARDVVSWRRDRLVAAGFLHPAAARLATDVQYDLPALTDLLARGSSPDLAVRILAALDVQDVA